MVCSHQEGSLALTVKNTFLAVELATGVAPSKLRATSAPARFADRTAAASRTWLEGSPRSRGTEPRVETRDSDTSIGYAAISVLEAVQDHDDLFQIGKHSGQTVFPGDAAHLLALAVPVPMLCSEASTAGTPWYPVWAPAHWNCTAWSSSASTCSTASQFGGLDDHDALSTDGSHGSVKRFPCDDGTAMTDCGTASEAADADESELEHGTMSVALTRAVEWCQDKKWLSSKKTRLTSSHSSDVGRFTFEMCPVRTSSARGGASFRASEGCGSLEVKCLSENPQSAGSLTHVAVGSHEPVPLEHDFSKDGLICRVPGVWNFRDAVDGHALRISFCFARSSS